MFRDYWGMAASLCAKGELATRTPQSGVVKVTPENGGRRQSHDGSEETGRSGSGLRRSELLRLQSVRIFLAAGVGALLQSFPPIGILLMVITAPLMILMINLGFAVLMTESITGPAPRWAVIFPIFWFLGYSAAAIVGHFEAKKFVAAMEAHNREASLAFDPGRQDLVLVIPVDGPTADASPTAEIMIGNYVLGRSWDRSEVPERKMKASWFSPRPCPPDVWSRSSDITGRSSFQGGHGATRTEPGICLFTREQKPTGPIVTVETRSLRRQAWLYEAVERDTVLRASDGRMVRLRSGHAEPLAWFPMPLIGCGLHSGSMGWDCSATFLKRSHHRNPHLVLRSDEAVAIALGLARREWKSKPKMAFSLQGGR